MVRVFTVTSLPIAILFCVVTMLGWGSWANTQKLAGKTEWPFELFYWDYAFGVFLFAVFFGLALGGIGTPVEAGGSGWDAMATSAIGGAFFSGAIFNVSNILLVVAIDAAGMSVAFPVGVGLALVIGTVTSYLQAPKGNPEALFGGVGLVILAMLFSAIAYSRLPRKAGRGWARGVAFAVVAGALMGFFYPRLVATISPDFNSGIMQPDFLSPYAALFWFAIGLLLSNMVVNTIFMKAGGKSWRGYFQGTLKLHALGILGGAIWMLALSLNVIASGVAGPAISYALGQGSTLVAAIWGVFIWKEFRAAPAGTAPYLYLMFAGYALGLTLIGLATL
jgi:glucose uptake protein